MLTALVRKLPAPAEFCLVVLVCSWWAIYLSIAEIAKHSRSAESQLQPSFTGIGVELAEKDGQVIIRQVMPDSPASLAGLFRGLAIQKIDGTPAGGKSLVDCVAMLRGPAGSKVELQLVDPARSTTNTVNLSRGRIQAAPKPYATNGSALTVAGLELLGLALAFWIARARNWPLGVWGFRPSWKLTGAGIILWLAMALAIYGAGAFVNSVSPGLVHKHSISDMSLPVVVFFAVINALFEEILESGYFIQSLQRYGMWSAVLASASFRAFLHAYHGITALIIIFPFGVVFGLVYWKWRRLWPLFVAHALFDLCAFLPE